MKINSTINKTYQKLRAHFGGLNIGNGLYKAKSFYKNRMTLHDKHEAWLDPSYKAALTSKEGAFIDVGANTGQTLIKILSFDQHRKYIGFEPQLDCCHFISEFIRENKLSEHQLFPIGLSNKSGLLNLLKRGPCADSAASTIEGFRPSDFYTDKQSIYVAKGDDILTQIDLRNISTIKIDVEGGELEVVEGLQKTLMTHKPFVFFEILNYFLAVTSCKLDEETIKFREHRNLMIEHLFKKLGYSIFNIQPDHKIIAISKISPKVSSDLKITDYVAVHNDHLNIFQANFKGEIISEKLYAH